MIVRSGAIEKARGMSEYYGMEALGHLGCLSDTPYSKALRELVAKVLERDS
jgi:geranylgeranyl pyrophosphate synthase